MFRFVVWVILCFAFAAGQLDSSYDNYEDVAEPIAEANLASREILSFDDEDDVEDPVRLPRLFRPHHYQLRLLPLLEQDNPRVNGSQQILVQCVENTRKIVMHSSNIQVDLNSVEVRTF